MPASTSRETTTDNSSGCASAAYGVASLDTRHTALTGAQTASAQADADADSRRDDLVVTHSDFHNTILGAKDSVVA